MTVFCCPDLTILCSPMEGMMAMSSVEWTPENIKKAEKACKEAQQTVLIKTIDVSVSGNATL